MAEREAGHDELKELIFLLEKARELSPKTNEIPVLEEKHNISTISELKVDSKNIRVRRAAERGHAQHGIVGWVIDVKRFAERKVGLGKFFGGLCLFIFGEFTFNCP